MAKIFVQATLPHSRPTAHEFERVNGKYSLHLSAPPSAGSHRIFEWLSEPILVAIAGRMVSDESATIRVGHGVAARQEMKLLAASFACACGAERTSPSVGFTAAEGRW